MTSSETTRLIRVEDRQKEMTIAIAAIQADMKANTKATQDIKSILDNLTGGKQALMWITGTFLTVCVIIVGWISATRQK